MPRFFQPDQLATAVHVSANGHCLDFHRSRQQTNLTEFLGKTKQQVVAKNHRPKSHV